MSLRLKNLKRLMSLRRKRLLSPLLLPLQPQLLHLLQSRMQARLREKESQWLAVQSVWILRSLTAL